MKGLSTMRTTRCAARPTCWFSHPCASTKAADGDAGREGAVEYSLATAQGRGRAGQGHWAGAGPRGKGAPFDEQRRFTHHGTTHHSTTYHGSSFHMALYLRTRYRVDYALRRTAAHRRLGVRTRSDLVRHEDEGRVPPGVGSQIYGTYRCYPIYDGITMVWVSRLGLLLDHLVELRLGRVERRL